MEHFDHFIRAYGVWAVLFWALLETDLVFILTGVAIDLEMLPAAPALAAAVLGGVLHDFFWFGLAWNRADWLRSTAVYRKVGPHVEKLVARFGVWQLFLCRFVYGTRNPSLVFWGIQKLPVSKFVFVNALGLLAWSGILAGLGYFLSDQAKALIGHVKQVERWLLTGLVLALVFAAVRRLLTRFRSVSSRATRPSAETTETGLPERSPVAAGAPEGPAPDAEV